MDDWDDLKHFLAVARHGSTIAAGRALGVSPSTVHRRIGALEARLGHRLVERHPSGYRLTAVARGLVAPIERVEKAVQAVEHAAGDTRRARDGVIRLTCPEPIVYRLIEFVDRFHARHPGLRIAFVTSDRYLDLTRGDADVAFRSGDTEDDLVGRTIAESVWAVYASAAYIARHGKPDRLEELAGHPLVSFDETLAGHRVVKWLDVVAPGATVAARNSSVLGLVYAVKAGLGIGPLPTAIADDEPSLVRVMGPVAELSRSWRILTTPELRRTARVTALFDFVVEERAALKSILAG